MPKRKVGFAVGAVSMCLAAVLTVVAVSYLFLGLRATQQYCAAVPPEGADWTSLQTGWSWDPPGFRCAYDGGAREEIRLWWDAPPSQS